MGERPPLRPRTLQVEYRFDRLLPDKLAHVYEVLVPGKRWPLGGGASDPASQPTELTHESASRHLRARLV